MLNACSMLLRPKPQLGRDGLSASYNGGDDRLYPLLGHVELGAVELDPLGMRHL